MSEAVDVTSQRMWVAISCVLLAISNVAMLYAWYFHLRYADTWSAPGLPLDAERLDVAQSAAAKRAERLVARAGFVLWQPSSSTEPTEPNRHLRHLRSMPKAILISWLFAGIEYCAMVPANRLGYTKGGLSPAQLRAIAEIAILAAFISFQKAALPLPRGRQRCRNASAGDLIEYSGWQLRRRAEREGPPSLAGRSGRISFPLAFAGARMGWFTPISETRRPLTQVVLQKPLLWNHLAGFALVLFGVLSARVHASAHAPTGPWPHMGRC